MFSIIINFLIKKTYYIHSTKENNSKTAISTTFLLRKNIGKFHDLAGSPNSDWVSQFLSGVEKNLYKIFGIKIHLSIEFHSETDR